MRNWAFSQMIRYLKLPAFQCHSAAPEGEFPDYAEMGRLRTPCWFVRFRYFWGFRTRPFRGHRSYVGNAQAASRSRHSDRSLDSCAECVRVWLGRKCLGARLNSGVLESDAIMGISSIVCLRSRSTPPAPRGCASFRKCAPRRRAIGVICLLWAI